MKFLREEIINDVEFKEVSEGEGKPKELFVEGVFLQGDLKNRNGRIYPMSILRNEVQRYMTESINKKNAWGELGHPSGPIINPERISHRIVSLNEDGKNFIGKAKITDTPMGNIAKNLIKEGSLAVSSRGVGSVRKSGGLSEVQEDFYLSTAADIVINPSAPDAFVQGIMESQEWIWANGKLREVDISELQEDVENATREKNIKHLKKLNEQAVLKMWKKFSDNLAK